MTFITWSSQTSFDTREMITEESWKPNIVRNQCWPGAGTLHCSSRSQSAADPDAKNKPILSAVCRLPPVCAGHAGCLGLPLDETLPFDSWQSAATMDHVLVWILQIFFWTAFADNNFLGMFLFNYSYNIHRTCIHISTSSQLYIFKKNQEILLQSYTENLVHSLLKKGWNDICICCKA